MDDVTLGKLLTEAHRGQADYCEPEGKLVSLSSSSVVFDGSGQPDGERNVDQSVNFGVTRNTWAGSSGRWVWDPAGSLAGMRRRPFWLKDDAASKQ